jgi:CheY-like chemotaxis protein
MTGQTVHVLMVEDDAIDAEQIVRSFARMKIVNPITIVKDGVAALNVLRGEDGCERLPRPYIILLDINMPRMNGLEFLRAIRADEELRQSVVFVLTTSDLQSDMMAAYAENVAGYFLKKDAAFSILGLPTLMKNYWRLVAFPETDAAPENAE